MNSPSTLMTSDPPDIPDFSEPRARKGLLSLWRSKPKYKTLFTPDNHCLSVNVVTSEVWLFHTPELKMVFDHAEYDQDQQRFFLVTEDKQRFDIGAGVGEPIREALSKAEMVSVIRTENRQPKGWFPLPIVQKKTGASQAIENEGEIGA